MPMRLSAIFLLCLTVFGHAAFAQAPQEQPTTPEQQAAQFMVNQLTSEKMNLLTQVASNRGQITELIKRLAESTKQIDDLNRQLTEARNAASAEKPSP